MKTVAKTLAINSKFARKKYKYQSRFVELCSSEESAEVSMQTKSISNEFPSLNSLRQKKKKVQEPSITQPLGTDKGSSLFQFNFLDSENNDDSSGDTDDIALSKVFHKNLGVSQSQTPPLTQQQIHMQQMQSPADQSFPSGPAGQFESPSKESQPVLPFQLVISFARNRLNPDQEER